MNYIAATGSRANAAPDPFDDDDAIERALREAIREAILDHKRAGNSIVVQEGDEIVELTADQIDESEADAHTLNTRSSR